MLKMDRLRARLQREVERERERAESQRIEEQAENRRFFDRLRWDGKFWATNWGPGPTTSGCATSMASLREYWVLYGLR